MGLFNIFGTTKGSKQIKGLIKYFSLVDWWLTAFSDDERKRIIEVYRPMGSTESIIEGDIISTSTNALNFLWCLAGWFNNKNDRTIAFKILDKAKEFVNSSPILDVHFYYSAIIDIYYPERNNMPDAMRIATDACLDQIKIAPEAAKAFKEEYPGQDLPGHRGYEQLSIIREKQKDFSGTIKICEQALTQGWGGNWQGRIDRNNRKSLIKISK